VIILVLSRKQQSSVSDQISLAFFLNWLSDPPHGDWTQHQSEREKVGEGRDLVGCVVEVADVTIAYC
jgi:hypothetical protein